MADGPAIANGGVAFDLGALEQRVLSVERGQATLASRIEEMGRGIDGRIDRLAQLIERRAQPQWQAFTAIWGVVVVVGGIIYLLISVQIGANRSQIDEARDDRLALARLLREDYVPRVELSGWRADDKDRLAQLAGAVADLRGNTITKSDHEALIDRVSRIEQTWGSTYSIGDVLKNIQDRLQRLEDRTPAVEVPRAAP